MCRLGCNRNIDENICEGGYNDGVNLHHYDMICSHYKSWMLGAITGCFITIYISLIETIARFSCCINNHKILFDSCSICKRGLNFIGNSVLYFSTILSLSLCLWSIIACFVLDINEDILVNIIISKLWSFIEWFIWSLPYFCYRYPGDKKRFMEKHQLVTDSQKFDNHHRSQV